MTVCFYCKSPAVSVCVCLACRTKFEIAKEDLERLKKDREIRKSQFFKKQKRKGRGK